MARLSVVVLSALIGATLASPAMAQWKWRDKGGQVQYSDLPPPSGVAEQDILQRPSGGQRHMPPLPAASAASAITPRTVDPELEAKRKKAEQDESAKKKAQDDKVAASRAESCQRAKSYLRTLDDGIRITRTKPNGEREFLDDKQRAEEVQRTRGVIASDCK